LLIRRVEIQSKVLAGFIKPQTQPANHPCGTYGGRGGCLIGGHSLGGLNAITAAIEQIQPVGGSRQRQDLSPLVKQVRAAAGGERRGHRGGRAAAPRWALRPHGLQPPAQPLPRLGRARRARERRGERLRTTGCVSAAVPRHRLTAMEKLRIV
jgi:hypothetical protein